MIDKTKFINDPVHDLVGFDVNDECDSLLLRLINTREFQRLRRIKQLGMSELVFPGASHTRFAHSIGVLQMARRFLERVQKLRGRRVDDLERKLVLTAALLHDLGHGPFSHAFEKITQDNHELRTKQIVTDPDTEVSQRLREVDAELPEMLVEFFGGDDEAENSTAISHPLLTQIISSQLDADRFDYLLRDSYMTKTMYGQFEHNWLIEHLYVDDTRHRFFLSKKALQAAEAYVQARYHMYRAVYFHKTTRAAEVMLRLSFQRFRKLAATKGVIRKKVPDAPRSLVAAFSGPMSLQQYLALDDHTISEFLKACESGNDPDLAKLGSGLLNRQLYKAVDVTGVDAGRVADFKVEATDLLKKRKFDPLYNLVEDGPADIPYKAYDPDKKPSTQIYIEGPDGGTVEISGVSTTIEQHRKKYTLLRYYYPAEVRENVDAVAEGFLGRKKN